MPAQVDRANCARIHAALMQAIRSGAAVIVADLTETDFCGHAATVMLVSAHALAAQAGTRLRVAAGRPHARLIGPIAGDGHRLDVYPDLTAALVGPRWRGNTCVRTATGYQLRVIPDEDARRSAGKLARSISVARRPHHAPPPRPPTAPVQAGGTHRPPDRPELPFARRAVHQIGTCRTGLRAAAGPQTQLSHRPDDLTLT